MENPDPNPSSSAAATKVALEPGPLPSLEKFLSDKEDKEDIQHYQDYLDILVARYKENSKNGKVPVIETYLSDAQKALKQYYVDGAIPGLNGAYQALCGPRPGDDLRKITPLFLVDGHQWKHYEAPKPDEWGKFTTDWRSIHKIVAYGAKLILAARALEIDRGATPKDAVLDGFVTFDQNIGLPGNKEKKAVTTMRVQISRTKTTVSGHGYPVPNTDTSFPCVNGLLRDALAEALSKDNDSPRSKT